MHLNQAESSDAQFEINKHYLLFIKLMEDPPHRVFQSRIPPVFGIHQLCQRLGYRGRPVSLEAFFRRLKFVFFRGMSGEGGLGDLQLVTILAGPPVLDTLVIMNKPTMKYGQVHPKEPIREEYGSSPPAPRTNYLIMSFNATGWGAGGADSACSGEGIKDDMGKE